MTIAKESFLSDGINTIFKLENKYSQNTVKGKSISTSNIVEDLDVTELGENYIEVSQVPLDYKIIIEYVIIGTLPTDNETEFDIKERIVRLEKGMEDMFKIIQAQKVAIDNRVNITSFRAWLNLVEKKMGIKLVDGNMNIISKELYKDK